MLNSAPGWRRNIQLLQNKIFGEDLKKQLIECLNICNWSHFENTRNSFTYQTAILDWEPPEYSETMPTPPEGWEIDDNGFYKPTSE